MLITISSLGCVPSTPTMDMDVEQRISQFANEQRKINGARKRKNTLVIPKNGSDGRFMKVVWTKLLKRQYMSNENPLELFDKLGNNRFYSTKYISTSSSLNSQVITSIPVRHLTARNTFTKNTVGLKVYGLYTADQCSICENECRILSLISSFNTTPNSYPSHIIQYEGSHYIGNSIWIETEPYCCNLTSVLSQQKAPLSESIIATVAKQLLESLAFLHGQGIAHRDIRPSNILVCKDKKNGYTFKLANFHAGYQLQPQDNGTIRDMASLMFTEMDAIQWLAPEMIAHQEGDEETVVEYDLKCDVWSFGLTVWAMVSRTTPFPQNNTPEDILEKLISSDFQPSLNDYSNGEHSLLFDDFLRKCCCRDAKKRWSSEELLNHEFLTKSPQSPALVNSLIKSTVSL